MKSLYNLFDIDSQFDILAFDLSLFVSLDCLSVGDYGGAGSVGAANLSYLKDTFKKTGYCSARHVHTTDFASVYTLSDMAFSQYLSNGHGFHWVFNASEKRELSLCDIIEVVSDYGGKTYYLNVSNPELIDIANGLLDYPLICDDTLCEIENQWHDEALGAQWSDIKESIIDLTENEAIKERIDSLDFDQFSALYWEAMNNAPDYPIDFEYSSAYIDCEKAAQYMMSHIGSTK